MNLNFKVKFIKEIAKNLIFNTSSLKTEVIENIIINTNTLFHFSNLYIYIFDIIEYDKLESYFIISQYTKY